MYEQYEDEIEALMEEPPHGDNHGYKSVPYTAIENGRPSQRMSLETDQHRNQRFRWDGGWTLVHIGHGGTKGNPGGGVLHPEEYVDRDLLRDMALEEFGFTAEEVASVYSTKKIKAGLSQLRADMDARMLALRRSGANMYQFAEAVGINQRTMNRALVRAEEAEGA